MIGISGFLGTSSEIPIVETQRPILVTSCGHYSLGPEDRVSTRRPAGRPDFQLLFVLRGKVRFWLPSGSVHASEGQLVLYSPYQRQEYAYEAGIATEAYWIHFSGREAAEMLQGYGLTSETVWTVPPRSEYAALFERIIRELQLQRSRYQELASLYFLELLTHISRGIATGRTAPRDEAVETTVQLFRTHYPEDFCVADCARRFNMSPCWFTRLFHRQTGLSPQQYLTQVRIAKAKDLLLSTPYSISETAAAVGYHNPLYFSRLFKQETGLSPSAYRAQFSSDFPAEHL